MRQAVFFIHGIGEPRPMTTLRGFVAGVVGSNPGESVVVRSKPDRLSESYEVRRLVAEGSRTRPATEFFEYYWAHKMEGNRVSHLWALAKLLLIRWPWRVPSRLVALWAMTWMFLILAGGAGIALYQANARHDLSKSMPVLWFAGTLGIAILQFFAARYLADAARYLSPDPDNVAIRQSIRSGGIDIVRRIQSSGRYDRIVVVGHSLGSVIAYDIITHLWDQTNTVHNSPRDPDQDALKEVERLGKTLANDGGAPVDEFRAAQRALWLEQRRLGNPWLVTDLVTLGSPLAHGALLLAQSADELKQRQEDRELPTCPPATDAGKYAYRSPTYAVNGGVRTVRVLHHASPFAVTRWTNLFVPLKWGVLGDWVGGPLRPLFGLGILDKELTTAPGRNLPLFSHTQYWRAGSSNLSAIREAIDLDSKTWLP